MPISPAAATLADPPPVEEGRRPVRRWAAGVVAAVWVAATLALPLCVVGLVGWVGDRAAASITEVVRLPLQVWLAGHLAPVDIGANTLTLRPLGVTLVVAYLLWRAGTWAGGACTLRTTGAVLRLVAWIAGSYAVLVAAVALVSGVPGLSADWRLAAVGAAALAATAGGAGVLRGSGRGRELRARAPEGVRVALDAGRGALLVLLGGGALLLAVSLTLHFSEVIDLYDALEAGPVGGFLLLLLSVALVPNAAIYAASYAIGPGFALGAGTTVSVGGSHLGALPALPLLGATPAGASVPAYAFLVFAIPTAAGILAGLWAIMRGSRARAEIVALRGLLAGPVVGVALLAAAWLASGGVGQDRLAVLGPTPWLVALIATAQVGVLAAVTAWVGAPRSRAAGAAADPLSGHTMRPAEVATASVHVLPRPDEAGVEDKKASTGDTRDGESSDDDEPTVQIARG